MWQEIDVSVIHGVISGDLYTDVLSRPFSQKYSSCPSVRNNILNFKLQGKTATKILNI